MEEIFTAQTRYVCQTEVRDRKIQSVKCKTIEVEEDEDDDVGDDSEVDFDDEDEDISSKHISIKQELKLLQFSGSISVDESLFDWQFNDK